MRARLAPIVWLLAACSQPHPNIPEVPAPACPGPSCPEACGDLVDNDEDGLLDCDDPDCRSSCDLDADDDGFEAEQFGGPDCDDQDPNIHPNADEVCNGIDDDCNGLVDEADGNLDPQSMTEYHTDDDGDGFGRPGNGGIVRACSPGAGMVEDATDCDDSDPATYPGAYEIPGDCHDNDCDGETGDEGCGPTGMFRVNDGPQWGTNPPVYSCLDACALLFGGVATDWYCSTDPVVVDNRAYSSTWGVGGCGVIAEDYKLDQGGGYDCGIANCSTSAYVTDNCTTAPNTNYCYPR